MYYFRWNLVGWDNIIPGALVEVRGARIAVTVKSVEVAKPLKAHGAGSESFFGSSIPTVLYCHFDGGEQVLVDTAFVAYN